MPRLAIAQLRPTKGDYGANLQKIGGVLAQIAKLDPPVDLAIGFYEVFQNHFYNSCLYASLGNASPGHASSGNASPGIRHVHRKVFLPTYGVFDEERFVDRGREIRAFDTRWGRAAILIW